MVKSGLSVRFVPLLAAVLGIPCLALRVATAQTEFSVTAADLAWDAVKFLGHPQPSIVGAGSVAPRLTPVQQAAKSADEANRLRAFQTQYPTHPAVREAKRLEALALNHGALMGDATQEARRTLLVTELRADEAIPVVARFEVVAWSLQVENMRRAHPTKAIRLAAHEAVANSLIAEFPTVADGYASLFAVGLQSASDRAGAIARQLINIPATPEVVKAEARRLVERLALIGKPIDELFANNGGTSLRFAKESGPTIIYSWTAGAAPSIALAKRMKQSFPHAEFVGVCLDPDTVNAQRVASASGIPGRQYFDARGVGSPLAAALAMGTPAVVLLADKAGVIRDVQGVQQTKAKLSSFAQ